MMTDDLLAEPLPIASSPDWGVPTGPGLGIDVDADKLRQYRQHYREHGQYLPYDIANMGEEESDA